MKAKKTYYSDKPVSVPLEQCIVHKDSEITKLEERIEKLERENKRLKYAFLEIIRQRFDRCCTDMDDWWQSAELSISNFDLWLDEVQDDVYIWYSDEQE